MTPPLYLWRGWVLATLWGWWVVPLGLPSIGVAGAVGLVAAASVLTPHPPLSDADADRTMLVIRSTVAGILIPLFALAVGWVAFLFGGGS